MKLLAVLLAVTLLLSVTVVSVDAKTTKEQSQKNRQDMEKAREEAKAKANPPRPVGLPSQYRYNIIAIELSKACIFHVKNNETNICPTYKELEKFDTTNKKYSGKFIEKDGFYFRDKPQWNNHWITYKDEVVCVDCSKKALQGSRIIEVVTKLDYLKNTDTIIKNATRYEYHNRAVDNCFYAKIVYSPILLNDTINYLKSGCTVTEFNEQEVIYMNKTKHDIKTTALWKYQQWLKDAKEKCKTKC